MFWLYIGKMSRFERSALKHAWGIHGSENHEIMHYSNALLAAQALKDRPAYRDRKLPDGRTLAQHYTAWNAYYKNYCDERAKHGLLIEVFAQYGSYTMPEIINMCDLSEDPALRGKMKNLLHLIWADWAVGQINGVRGGGRTRLYQDDPKKPINLMWGKSDRWRQMGEFFLNGGIWKGGFPNHPISGCALVLATTTYRLPDLIMDIATDAKGRGEYVYIARRVAKQRNLPAKEVTVTYSPWYAFDGNDPGMLGYDYCTPDYVMGSLLIDPSLPLVDSISYLKGKALQEGYPNLTSQNRYHSIVFASDINARVVPQCEGLNNGKTYGQQQAVQNKNVLLVQRHAKANQTGDMRIIFGGKGMRERLLEHDGWMILKEGEAWFGVKGFSQTKANESCGYNWDDEVHLRMKDGKAPVALVAGRSKEFADQDAFAAYLGTFVGTIEKDWFSLSSRKADTEVLSLHLSSQALPKVGGKPINLSPKALFDSPFLKSEHGSGIVNIQKGIRKLTIDMSKARE